MKMNKKLTVNKITPFLLLIPSLAGQCIFTILPFINVIKRSFFKNAINSFQGFSNYIIVLENESFRLAAKNTLLFLAVSIAMIQLIAMLLAYIFSYLKDLGKTLKSINILPLALPAASVAIFWSTLFDSKGFLNGILNRLQLPEVDWLNSEWGLLALVILFVWKNVGFITLLWSIGLKTIPQYVYESAKIDGADKRNIFVYIVLPNMKTTFFTTTVFSLASAFKIYREAYLLMGDYPSEYTYLLQHIFNNWFRNYDFDKLAASSVLYGAFIILLMIPLFKLNKLDEG